MSKIADVLIEDVPLKGKDLPLYSYLIPEKFVQKVEVGKRVFVPFGRGNKLKKGIIIKIWEGQQENLKEIIDLVSDFKIIDEGGIKVLFKLKEKYFAPVSNYLKKILPLGKSKKGEEIIKLIDSEFEKHISPREKRKIELLSFLLENEGEIKLRLLKKFFSSNVINDLIKRGVIVKTYEFQKERKKELSKNKEMKFENIKEILIEENTLLYGYTYKERWNYYLDLIKSYVSKNKKIKIIFPEKIELEEFYKFIPDEIKKISEKITGEESKNERERILKDINEDRLKVLFGTTISLLLPLNENLLIIENESSFKNLEDLLSLKILDLSKTYINEKNIKILIGSFYPSFEALITSKKEKFNEIKKKISLKNIEIIYRDSERLISPYLKNIILKNKNRKIFIFYPRKGYYQYLFCDECGYTAKCPKDKVPLTFFKEERKLICKICGYEKFPFDICPECGGFSMRFSSPGIERVKERLKRIFYDKKIFQLDEWITKGSEKKRKEIVNEFILNGDIIIGTQLILSLLKKINEFIFIFLDIDFMLNFPEYDSFENIFYLLLRVLEDSIVSNGKVYIQTRFPNNIVFKAFKERNLNLFINEELKRRKETKFPPYYKYIVIEDVQKNYYDELIKLKENDDEIYYSDGTLKIKTKNFFKFDKIFDKIKYEKIVRIKEF
ncbi:MAG: hypothetical protein N3D74_00055 [Caldisericia bacterium]|nr:hypothetical protein [Caldisericia bacterium]